MEDLTHTNKPEVCTFIMEIDGKALRFVDCRTFNNQRLSRLEFLLQLTSVWDSVGFFCCHH